MTNPVPHPISLEQIVFTRSVVIAVPEHVPNPKKLAKGPNNTLNFSKIEGEPHSYTATMHTVMNPEADAEYPYSIDMECIGILHTDGTLTEEEAQRGIYITANSVMYGAIREAVAWITGRQPYGTLLLGLSVLPSATPPKST